MYKEFKEEIDFGGKKLTLATGKIARQADGAIIATWGETVVIATVVGASPLAVIFTVGTLLYPKPVVANVTVSNANPKIGVPAAFAPVVSPATGVNEILGADP